MVTADRNGVSACRSGRLRWLVWLALFALVIKIVVPDLAMAAHDGRRTSGPVDLAALTRLVDGVSGDAAAWCGRTAATANDPSEAPVAQHDDGLCPFCLALSAQALPPDRSGGAALFARAEAALPQGADVHRPPSLFPPCPSPRAPPAS